MGYTDSQCDTLGGPAGSHTSQLDLTVDSRASDKTGSFLHNYFVTGEDDKAIFLYPAIQSFLLKEIMIKTHSQRDNDQNPLRPTTIFLGGQFC
jgi:hypothetical protein